MRETIFLLIVCLCLMATSHLTSFAQKRTYRISAEDSRIGFVATKWMVFKEEGRFTRYEGKVDYDTNDPSTTSVSLSVQTASVDSRDPDRDQVVRSRDLLDAKRFPAMMFRSSSVRQGNKDTLLVTGDLSIRDVTHRVTVPVKVLGATSVRNVGELVGFEAEFSINRFDYGVAGFPQLIGKDIIIHMLIGAIAK